MVLICPYCCWDAHGCAVIVVIRVRMSCPCHGSSFHVWFHVTVVLFMPCGFMTCHGGFVHAMWVSRMSWWFYSCHESSFHVMVVLFMPRGFITCHGFIDHVMMTYYMSWCLFSCHGHLLHVMAVLFMPWWFITCHGGFVHAMWVYYMSRLFCSGANIQVASTPTNQQTNQKANKQLTNWLTNY